MKVKLLERARCFHSRHHRIVPAVHRYAGDEKMASTESACVDVELGVFSTNNIEVRVDPMLRIQGYTDLSRVRKVVKETAQAMATLAETCFDPQVCYLRTPIRSCSEGILRLHPGTVFHCDAFSKFLPGCHEVVIFVLTVGEAFDQALDKLQRDDKLLEALFFENAGWLGVETVTRRFSQYLRDEAGQRHEKMTRRLSPGYSFKLESGVSEWSLFEQAELFGLFDGKVIPVKVLESGAMLPKMSRSGLYGMKRLA